MSTITMVRHGQANTDARDEADYDRLSDLGHRQADWLGDYLRSTGEAVTRIYSGTLTRHRQTAQSMGYTSDIIVDHRLNELEFFNMAQAFEAEHGVPVPQTREDFAIYMPRLFEAWRTGQIKQVSETFDAFEIRVREALADIASGQGPALVVTSGGLIAMAVRQAMGLDMDAFARTALAIMNTSIHRLHPISGRLSLTQFNAVPHLAHPDRQFAQTHL